MGKAELGQKMTCADCAARFYDLSRSPIVCPKCGVEQRPARQGSPYPGRTTTRRWLPRSGSFVHIEAPLGSAVADAGIDAGDPLDSVEPPDEDDATDNETITDDDGPDDDAEGGKAVDDL